MRSNVVGYLALFVALSGSAYAASKITASDIAKNAVRGKHIKNNTVKGPDVNEAKLAATPLRTRVAQGNCNKPSVPGTGPMVKVGATCIDKFEASVWTSPTGGTQLGVTIDDYTTVAGCDDNGQNCKGKIFARSVPGVTPSRYITWFQAEAALSNSGKRLPQNNEWQKAVQGTPDGAPCVVSASGPANTGSAGCTSAYGAHDMVGNVWEWVADWVPRSTTQCSRLYGNDFNFFCGASTSTGPGALIRGGNWDDGTGAGPFDASAGVEPSSSDNAGLGFRGAR